MSERLSNNQTRITCKILLLIAILLVSGCSVMDYVLELDDKAISPVPIASIKAFHRESSDEIFFVSTFEHDDPTNRLWWTGNIGIQQAGILSGNYSMFINGIDAGLLSLVDMQVSTQSYMIQFTGNDGYGSHEANQYGIVFNFVDASNYSLFLINGYGQYAIGYFNNWTWYSLHEGDLQDVNILNRAFSLSVTVSKNEIIPSVNNDQLPAIQSPIRLNGQHGIYLGSLISNNASLLVSEYSVSSSP